MESPSVREVWRLALPAGAWLLNHPGDLSCPVTWAQRMAFHPPLLAGLEEHELLLLPVDALSTLNADLTLADIIEALAERHGAALAISGEATIADRAAADRVGLPLFRLPVEADLRDVEKAIIRLIVEREAQLDRRGRQVYRQLAQISLENRGLPAIAQTLQQITGKSVVIQDERYNIQALTLSDDCPLTEAEVRALMTDQTPQRHWDLQPPLDDKSPPCSDFPTAGGMCSVAAIVTEGRLSGYLALLGAPGSLDALDRLAAERGALVCAFEFAKQRIVAATEQRLQGDFLDALLSGKASEEGALARRAAELGYALERDHVVLLLAEAANAARPLTLLAGELRAALFAAGLHTLICPHAERLALLCNAEDAARLQSVSDCLAAARARVAELAPGSRIAVGVGRPGAGLTGLRHSFAQAEESLALAQTLFAGDKVLSFGELRLYHLLYRLQTCEELSDFYAQTLGPLAAYDAAHDTQFIPTLEAFFAHHGNVSQTAESLFLHRNSLLYRLERIRDIAALDLDAADDRFALQLALKLRPLVDTSCKLPQKSP